MNGHVENNAGSSSSPASPETPSLRRLFHRGDLWTVFLAALFLRLVMFAAANNQIGTQGMLENCFDCRLYLNMAKAIVAGTPEARADGFFYFGPGFAYFLAPLTYLFKNHAFSMIVVDIILSSLSCLLLYAFARRLTGSYAVAMTAAFLAATSYTSILVSCFLLSDTLYFFVFLLVLLAYLRALDTGRWPYFVLAGVLTAAAVMIRSVGQFWPLVMIGLAVAHRRWKDGRSAPLSGLRPRALTARVTVAVAIPIVVILGWMSHNYRDNGAFVMGITSGNGPANICAVTIERMSGVPAPTTMENWLQERKDALGKTELTLGEIYDVYRTHTRAAVDTLGWKVVETYLSVMWENLNEISRLHRLLFPEYQDMMIPAEEYIMHHYLNYINIVLAMTGLALLLWRRRWWPAAVLGSTYVYYAVMGGFFRWQYTRHFMPGQIAWAVLIAVTLVTLARLIGRAGRALARRSRPEYHRGGIDVG